MVSVALAEVPELIPGLLLHPAEAEPAEPSFTQSTPSTRTAGLLPTWSLAIFFPVPEELEPTRELRLIAGSCCSSDGVQKNAIGGPFILLRTFTVVSRKR